MTPGGEARPLLPTLEEKPPAYRFLSIATEGTIMRAYHVIAVVAVVLVGVGVKLTQLRNVQAQYVDGARGAYSSSRSEEDQNAKNLAAQRIHDASGVSSGGNLTAGGIAAATSDDPRKGLFSPRCAERELRVFTVIEEFGETGAVPSAWLATAGLNWLQARLYCLSGAEDEAVILYDRVIVGDARLPSEWTMK